MIAITIAFIYEYGPRLVWFKLVANVQKYFERIQHVYIPIIKMSAINKRQSLVVSSVFTTFFENLDLQYYGIGVILNICKETKMIYIVSLYFVYEISQSDHECECVCVLVVCVCVLGVGWGWYAVYFSICTMFSLCRLLANKNDSDLWHISLELHFLNMVSVCHLWMRENLCHHPWFVPRIQDLSTQQYQEARIFQ